MPFYGIQRQPGIRVIKLKSLSAQFRPGDYLATGIAKGQYNINYYFSSTPLTE